MVGQGEVANTGSGVDGQAWAGASIGRGQQQWWGKGSGEYQRWSGWSAKKLETETERGPITEDAPTVCGNVLRAWQEQKVSGAFRRAVFRHNAELCEYMLTERTIGGDGHGVISRAMEGGSLGYTLE